MSWIRNAACLTEEAAWTMIAAARGKARELNLAVHIAVVDQGAHLLAYSRMDGAQLLSERIAQDKAYTAVASGRPSGEWYPRISQNPALLHGIVHTDRLVIFGGGVPVVLDGAVVGAIGVSGGSSDQDQACAEAGIRALSAQP